MIDIPYGNSCKLANVGPAGVNELQLAVVETVLTHIGVDYVIAGGYARDTFFDERRPKDVDIFVTEDLTHITEALHDAHVAFTDYPTYDEQDVGDGRIGGVIKVGTVDIIQCSSAATSPRDHVVRFFDYNINQFIIGYDGDIEYVGDGTTFGKLARVYKEQIHLSETRIAKIIKIAKGVDWYGED